MTSLPEIPAPQSPPVDVAAFQSSMDEAGAGSVVPMILQTFLEDLPQRMEQIQAAVGGGDPLEIRRTAHALKSSAGSIHAQRLYVLLGHLEEAGRIGELSSTPELGQMLIEEAQRSQQYLTQLLGGGDSGTLPLAREDRTGRRP